MDKNIKKISIDSLPEDTKYTIVVRGEVGIGLTKLFQNKPALRKAAVFSDQKE